MAKTLNKLRQEPLNTATTNGRSTPIYAGPTTPSRPMTSRATSHPNANTATASNFYYQLPGGTKGPLPAELISKRSTSFLTSNNLPNGVSYNRVSSGTSPFIVQQPTTSVHNEIRLTDTSNMRAATPLRIPAKSLDAGLHQVDGFDYNSVTVDEYPDKFRVKKKK